MPEIECLLEIDTGLNIRQLRAVTFENAGRTGLILAHADTPDQQPAMPHFIWPGDTLKISAFSFEGDQLWQHDVGRGVVPGLWFCPVFPFDLDGDGVDEIYHVGNSSGDKPFDKDSMDLTCLSSDTGKIVNSVPWPWFPGNQTMSDTFRYFINGGYSDGAPRLVTSQGQYHEMTIQCWGEELELLWNRRITPGDPGARASHMFSVLDIDDDGKDEVFLGERCIDIETGEDRWVADLEGYRGHSDIVMPTLNRDTGKWSIFTCREFPWPEGSRGVVMFDDQGREKWGYRGMEHVHDGWTARLCDDGAHLCFAMEKFKEETDEGEQLAVRSHVYDMEGNELEPKFPLETTIPVDVDGDGRHELLYRYSGPHAGMFEDRAGLVIDRHGEKVGRIVGRAGNLPKEKLLDCPGEQIMTHDGSGTIRIYGCPDAEDSPEARERYAHPYYKSCKRLWAVGYNWRNLGGI